MVLVYLARYKLKNLNVKISSNKFTYTQIDNNYAFNNKNKILSCLAALRDAFELIKQMQECGFSDLIS